MIDCKYRKNDCCQLISEYGQLQLNESIVSDKACEQCLKTNTPNDGECNSIIASLVIYNTQLKHPERNKEIRKKFLSYCKPKQQGPGTELKKIFDKLLIREKDGCQCASHARVMDKWGPDTCLERIEEILDWLQDEASERDLPFVRSVAKAIVRLAIRRARKNHE